MKTIQKLPTRYKPIKALGKGSIGKVYKVYDSQIKKNLALKILSSSFKKSQSSIIKEFKILSQLNHPSLVKVYDFGFLPTETPYFSMELVEGINLKDFFQNDSNVIFLPLIIKQILSALCYLHSNEILHGDIKPENILIVRNNKDSFISKLVDFGLTITTDNIQHSISGTPRFIAPEIYSSGKYSSSSDFYALGLSIIECITNKKTPIAPNITPDFYLKTRSALINKFKIHKINNPSSITSFILDLSQLNPEDRPKDAKLALQTFLTLIGDKESMPDFHTHDLFIDRKKEINIISRFLSKETKIVSVLLLEGLTGVGKKSILHRIIHKAQLKAYIVIDLENGYLSQHPLELFLETLSSNLSSEQKKHLYSRHSNILSSLHSYKEVDTKFSPRNSSPILYDNIIHFLNALSQERPILICIPDIERYTEDFIYFVLHLAYETNYLNSNTKIIVTRNSDTIITKHILECYRDLKAFEFAHIHEVEPLNEPTINTLLQIIFNQNLLSKKERRELFLKTSGVPLLVIELIKHLISKGVIYWEEGKWFLNNREYRDAAIPENFKQHINFFMQDLSSDEKTILQTIAIWGSAIFPEQLYNIVLIENDIIDNIIKKHIKSHILKFHNNRMIYFEKPMYAELINKLINYKNKRQINKRIALHLHSNKSTDYIRLANYFINAKIVDESLNYSLKAANKMLLRYEYYDCLSLLQKAKILIKKKGNTDQLLTLLNKIAPLELQTGLSKEAIHDYKTLIYYTGDISKKAYYLFNIAHIYNDLWGQKDKAKKIYKESLKYAEEINNIDLSSEILIKLGEVSGIKGNSFLIKAAELSKDRNINQYARALSELLFIYKISGNINKLDTTLKEIVNLLKSVDIKSKKSILFKLITIYFYKGDYRNAKKLLLKKIQLEDKTHDELEKIESLKALGGCNYVEGNFHETIKTLKEALILSRKYNNYLASLTILSNLILAYRYLAEYRESINLLLQVNEIISKHKITRISSTFFIKPLSLFLILGKHREREFFYYLRKTKNYAKKANNSIVKGHCQLSHSLYYYQKLNIKDALPLAKEALKLFKESDDNDDIVNTLIYISIYLNEVGHYKEAYKYIKEAKKIYNEIHCEYLKPLLLLSDSFCSRVNNIKDTEKNINYALRISKNMGTREYTWQIQRELSLYYKEIGAIQLALRYYKDASDTLKQITESIETEEDKLSYLSLPIRRRVFNEIKELKQSYKLDS